MSEPFPVRAAHAVLDDLIDRSGFDGWWGSLDAEIRGEILADLAAVVDEQLHADPQPTLIHKCGWCDLHATRRFQITRDDETLEAHACGHHRHDLTQWAAIA